MPEKTKNPFVVEVESPVVAPPEPVVAKPEPVAVSPVLKKVTLYEPQVQQPKAQWGMFFTGVGITLILCGISFGVWLMNSQRKGLSVTPLATPEALVLPTPLPSPSPIVWSSRGVSVDVLNGTGVPGKAATIATKLEALGYTKGTTGNADKQTGSTLSLTSDLASHSAEILAEVKSVVTDATLSAKPLKGKNLIQVVIGE